MRDMLDDLHELSDRMLQYAYLVECGRDLPSLSEEFRTDEFLVPECQARTWVGVKSNQGGREVFGDSESLVVRGALSLVKELCDGRSADEIASCGWSLFDDEAFSRHFTKMQVNGLRAAVKRVARSGRIDILGFSEDQG